MTTSWCRSRSRSSPAGLERGTTWSSRRTWGGHIPLDFTSIDRDELVFDAFLDVGMDLGVDLGVDRPIRAERGREGCTGTRHFGTERVQSHSETRKALPASGVVHHRTLCF